MGLEHSRAVRLAAGAAGRAESELEQALEGARVAVSVDPRLPGAQLTARVLLTTLRRLPGELVLERGGLSATLVDEIAAAVSAVDPERPLVIESAGEATARLHIGADRGDEAIRLVPEGHGAHVAGQRNARIRPRRGASPLGSVFTAALGAGEAFKHMAQVRANRAVLHRHLRFCPVTLSSDLSAAPALDEALELDVTLLGIGAIGTGVVLILAELDVFGRLVAVDYEYYAPENRGTYSLGGAVEVAARLPKVDMAGLTLPRFDVLPFPCPVETLPAAIDEQTMPWLPLVVSGLDSAEARRAAQRLWPDRLIDAATGDTMLGLHEHVAADGPCMICFFPAERGGPSAGERLAEICGLPAELLARGDEILREEHLEHVSDAQRALLVEHLGKPVCGLARAAGLTDLAAAGYRPSVPFISLQASVLAVGRVLARELGVVVPLPNLVQYDGLIGPQGATLEKMRPTDNCYCQARAKTIERVRARRASYASASG